MITAVRVISLPALRRLVIRVQRYAGRRRRGTTPQVERTIAALSCVQLDSISTVERSHRIVLASRTGAYPEGAIDRLLREGRVFEYWAHEACLIPVQDWPLFRPAMEDGGRSWYSSVERTHPHLREDILERIRTEGALGSRDFEGEVVGGMWRLKPAKAMLVRLWNDGELVVAGREGFQRVFDLPERVLPRSVLDAPVPSEEARLRELALGAVRARGALTESGIAEHWRLRGGARRVRPAVDGLVAGGALERVAVADGGAPVVVEAGADLDPDPPRTPVLLSPFDNLLWDRRFAARVLAFEHVMEIYKRPHERRYGYYVLPFLRGDRLVARVDLKSERAAGELVVKAVHREPGVRRSGAFDDALDRALDRLRDAAGLETVRR
jgi:uncharacterized protein